MDQHKTDFLALPIPIRTDRLILRPHLLGDLDDLLKFTAIQTWSDSFHGRCAIASLPSKHYALSLTKRY